MVKWFIYATALIVVCFFGGLALIAVSGHGGSRGGGLPVVWHVGGLMVYAAVICAPICFLAGAVVLAVEGVVARHRPHR